MTPADDAWLRPLARRRRRDLAVRSRTPLTGGYASGGTERIDLDDGTAVVLKRTGAVETAALRAVAVVNGPVRLPRMLGSGDGWVLLDHEPGAPLPVGAPVPDDVWRTLALVHAHWRRNRPRGVPVVDDAWWARLCGHAADRLRAAGHDTAAASVVAWAGDDRARTALRALPRTLCHGDAHRGNVVAGPAGAVLLDWGNARVAVGSLDVVVLAAPPSDGPADAPSAPVPAVYRDTLSGALGAPDPPAMVAVETAWARAAAHVQYLPFAADHQDPDRVASMVRVAAAALDELGDLLVTARRG
ncbi:aminoglycoside phosphotransferase family protein [Pseudonocardia sp. DR1-2]|uniref:phosphotransferase n=1 Tax=Pseudonocardia sp. DR1-2 TaxID=2951168 RepID=UPI0020440038|nr:phosphotransferase [Pseudonocardia sp. DR1-2]MCM3846478.1 aminoglycoside phosphotransferase family protein [Pseudonocardia sp. DR1-2]